MSEISIKLMEHLFIDLNLEERLTFIGGDSGTGKTLFVKALQDLVLNPDLAEIQGIGIDKFMVCLNEQQLPNILNCKNKIIIIDRYDIYSKKSKEQIWNKMSNLDNTWILMTRNPDIKENYGHSSRSYKILKTKRENNQIKLYLERY